MAQPRFIQLFDSTDTPLTSASPVFVDYRDRTGTSRTTPGAPTHVGSGLYSFTPSDADESVGTVALIDNGVGALPRYMCVAVHRPDNSNQFWAFHVETAAGVLWTGTAPTVGAYRNSSGTGVTPVPTLTAVSGAYLYVATPSSTDIAGGVGIWVSYPAGASTQGYSGFTLGISTAVSTGFTISGTTPTTHYLDLTFTDSVAPLTLAASDYHNWILSRSSGVVSINSTGVGIIGSNVVRVYHTKPHNGDLYILTLPITGLKSVANVAYNDSATLTFTAVAAPAVLTVANYLDIRHTRVIFSEPVLIPESLNPANYSFSPPVPTYNVIKETDVQYVIVTAPQTIGTNYTVTASNIKDTSLNLV